jgi:hypothetical protein
VTTLIILLATALLGSLAGNVLLWRLWKTEQKNAAGEARRAALESFNALADEVKDAANVQDTINAVDRGGAADVLDRLRKSGSP